MNDSVPAVLSGIVAALVGCARPPAGARNAWRGTFVALFQPSEEDGRGRRRGAPFTYGGIGGADPALHARAEPDGTVAQGVPVNHGPFFAPVLQPALDRGASALAVAALSWPAVRQPCRNTLQRTNPSRDADPESMVP